MKEDFSGPKPDQLKINEIFFSIQGESSFTGRPTVFVRTTACNLRCTYCDTKYSYYEGQWMPFDEIFAEISGYGADYVCLTGGEPLLQRSSIHFMQALCDRGYHVSLETSGSKSIEKVDPRVNIILDVKTPDSGAGDSFLESNLELDVSWKPHPNVEFKFVICSERDFHWAEVFCRQHEIFKRHLVLYSPSHGVFDPARLAEMILKEKSKASLQLQIHKYIWSSDARGV